MILEATFYTGITLLTFSGLGYGYAFYLELVERVGGPQ